MAGGLIPSELSRDVERVAVGNPECNRLRQELSKAKDAWLKKSPSRDTRENYERDLEQFMAFIESPADEFERLVTVRPEQVAEWRDALLEAGMKNSSVRRKLTALRAFFSYLQVYGYQGRNPAHGDFVNAPAVARDGKTVGLDRDACRRLLDAPEVATHDGEVLPAGIRDRGLLAVLAYTGCRVGELTRLKVGSQKQNGVHRMLEIHGKGGKERSVPLHPEAAERLEAWLDAAGIRDDFNGPLFRPNASARGEWNSPRQDRPAISLARAPGGTETITGGKRVKQFAMSASGPRVKQVYLALRQAKRRAGRGGVGRAFLAAECDDIIIYLSSKRSPPCSSDKHI